MKRKIISILLTLPLTFFGIIGCSGDIGDNSKFIANVNTIDLMENVVADKFDNNQVNSETQEAVGDFLIELFNQSLSTSDDQNIMISPISILNALAMTSIGANGETLSEMENVFGASNIEVSKYLNYYNTLIEKNSTNRVNLANSIWFKDSQRFEVNQEFLQTNKNYYDADIYKSKFNEDTLNDINAWVKTNTDGMIENIIDEIPESAIMYLINAISFDAEWEEIYKDINVNEGEFFNLDGSISKVDFMTSQEQKVIELDTATGFIKPYKNNEYSFIGLLPNKGIDLSQVSNELSTINLSEILENFTMEEVDIILPKFNAEYSTDLSNLLVTMGMPLAFDSNNADFSKMAVGDGNIYIGKVLHKTYINVDEKGTQAGASTAVEMMMKMSMPIPKRELRFNNPFIYIIVDNTNNQPIFIGNINYLE